jgi:hypothetical protein
MRRGEAGQTWHVRNQSGELKRQLYRSGLLFPARRHRMISRMLLQQLIRVCGAELRKAKRAIVAAYEMMREADDRALQFLFILLGIR